MDGDDDEYDDDGGGGEYGCDVDGDGDGDGDGDNTSTHLMRWRLRRCQQCCGGGGQAKTVGDKMMTCDVHATRLRFMLVMRAVMD